MPDSTLVPTLPVTHSRAFVRLTVAAAAGRFELQRCARCGAWQYPPREACHVCLSLDLEWTVQTGLGRLISQTTLFHSHDRYFQDRLPWRIGLVRLDDGPVVLAHLQESVPSPPTAVRVMARLDRAGQAVLVAAAGEPALSDDRRLRELTCNPQGCTALVTDGGTVVGAALARELLAAGVRHIWLGHRPEAERASLQELIGLGPVSLLALDPGSDSSVKHAAEQCADKIDLLVNNFQGGDTDCSREPESSADEALMSEAEARSHMETHYFGLLRLANEFGPSMRSRAGSGALGWVNVLSVCALANFPPRSPLSASMAAAHSLSQWLRSLMRPVGLRVINVFPGRIQADELARALTAALRETVEDVYPDPLAVQWLERWKEHPRVLEREVS